MKILVTTHNSNGSSLPIATTVSADTALTRSDKPLFLPTHIAAGFNATPAIAWQVGRVGKCIARRFAWRYCHAVAPAMLVTACDFTVATPFEPTAAMASAFDGALMLGDFSPVDADSETLVEATVNGNPCGGGGPRDLKLDAPGLIEHLSRFFTLKTGDIIVSDVTTAQTPLAQGDTVEMTLDGTPALTVRVK